MIFSLAKKNKQNLSSAPVQHHQIKSARDTVRSLATLKSFSTRVEEDLPVRHSPPKCVCHK